jgi:hypothetical protein
VIPVSRNPRTAMPEEREAANHGAWVSVLDRLQRDVEAIERTIGAGEPVTSAPAPEPWQPPALDGPLPDSLLARATELHRRQSAARAFLTDALARARAEQQAVPRSARAGATAHGTASAYVDISA